jgi:hypothetical protein
MREDTSEQPIIQAFLHSAGKPHTENGFGRYGYGDGKLNLHHSLLQIWLVLTAYIATTTIIITAIWVDGKRKTVSRKAIKIDQSLITQRIPSRARRSCVQAVTEFKRLEIQLI